MILEIYEKHLLHIVSLQCVILLWVQGWTSQSASATPPQKKLFNYCVYQNVV